MYKNLVGSKEVCELLGWSKGQLTVYRSRGKFPEPVVVLSATPIWTTEQIEQFINGRVQRVRFSYDYEELIQELESDIAEGLIQPDEMIRIVRGDKLVGMDYAPIIDYYFCTDSPEEEIEEVIAFEVLKEMIELNKII